MSAAWKPSEPSDDSDVSGVVAAFELGRQCGSLANARDELYIAGWTAGVEFCDRPTKPEPWRSTNYRYGVPRRRSVTHPKGRVR